jgi:hypothetical protein
VEEGARLSQARRKWLLATTVAITLAACGVGDRGFTQSAEAEGTTPAKIDEALDEFDKIEFHD